MNFSVFNPAAKRVRFEKNTMWVELLDGRILGVPLAYFPRLFKAHRKDLKKYTLSGGGTGIHWDALNEDISVAKLVLGIGDCTFPNQMQTESTSS
jgi:hypothetical protein